MSNYEAHLRIFLEGRMQPWHPENNLFIVGELAKMSVVEPDRAASMKKHYDDKMAKYVLEHPEKFATGVPDALAAVNASPLPQPEELPELKKPRGRPKKVVASADPSQPAVDVSPIDVAPVGDVPAAPVTDVPAAADAAVTDSSMLPPPETTDSPQPSTDPSVSA